LIDIYSYVAANDSGEKAEYVLDRLQTLCLSLDKLATRDHIPPQFERIGVTCYRQDHFKPYRVIYQISGQNVYIHCVLDGRRDMQSLMERRLLRWPGSGTDRIDRRSRDSWTRSADPARRSKPSARLSSICTTRIAAPGNSRSTGGPGRNNLGGGTGCTGPVDPNARLA